MDLIPTIKLCFRLVNPSGRYMEQSRAATGNFGIQIMNMGVAPGPPTWWIRAWDTRNNDRYVLDALFPGDKPDAFTDLTWDQEGVEELRTSVEAALVLDTMADI